MYAVENDPTVKEASGILIRSLESGEVLVRLSGPMSVSAAGAFIVCMKNKHDDLIHVAVTNHIDLCDFDRQMNKG